MSREAMQIALDALEANLGSWAEKTKAVEILRQTLEQEPVACEPQYANEDGWCDWVCPKPRGYLMQCCGCELIHEVDFRVVRYESEDSEAYAVVDDPNLQAQMRLRRRDDLSPKREWVELTDDVVFTLADTNLYDGGKNFGVLAFAKAIEQALKEKNT